MALWMLQGDLRAEAQSVIETAVELSGEDHYRGAAGYPAATGYLSRNIDVPALPRRRAVEDVLDARLRFDDGVHLGDLLTDGALTVLWQDYHAGDHNLRHCLLKAHTALQLAADSDAHIVGAHHVEAAIARPS